MIVNLDFTPIISQKGGDGIQGTFPHLIDEKVSKILGEKIMMEKPELFEIGYSLFTTGSFETSDESKINAIKEIVTSTNEYNGIKIDGLYKAQIFEKFQ